MRVSGGPDLQALLSQMRALASEARSVQGADWGRPAQGADFGRVLSESLAAVKSSRVALSSNVQLKP